jgi:hypothetical protein
VYSSNLGFDEFFMISTFLGYIKITQYLNNKEMYPQVLTFVDFLKLWFTRYIRLAPVYYLVFLTGWLIGPYVNTGPWWFTYQMSFCDCEHYWWSVFLMTINLYPGYVVANEGCFYWGWYVACELQLFLVVPFFVYLLEYKLKDNKCVANFFIYSLMCLGIGISFYVLYSSNMAAGLFAPQDILIYKLWLNKAYTKLHCVALGMWTARIFLEVNEQKLKGAEAFEEFKNKSIFKSTRVAMLAAAMSIGTLGFVAAYPRSANEDPTSWKQWKSATFIAFGRIAFCLAVICLWYLLFLDHFSGVKRFFTR